jgi:hypothetical protein
MERGSEEKVGEWGTLTKESCNTKNGGLQERSSFRHQQLCRGKEFAEKLLALREKAIK